MRGSVHKVEVYLKHFSLGGWMSFPMLRPSIAEKPLELIAGDFGTSRVPTDANTGISNNKSGKSEPSLGRILPLISSWSTSRSKRVFDCVCVLPLLPIIVPVLVIIALAVRLTSRGPAFFFQKRMGLHGRSFTIFKFRTLEHRDDRSHNAVTTSANQRFTLIGPFLRRSKLDELPQLLNVLNGDMSLVGPRPKLPEHQLSPLFSRPGITGAATLAFAKEESFLARLPGSHLDHFYQDVILPSKQKLDQEYAARATFLSDLQILLRTLSRKWDTSIMEDLLSVRSANYRSPAIRSQEIELSTTIRQVFVTPERTESLLSESGPSLIIASETQTG